MSMNLRRWAGAGLLSGLAAFYGLSVLQSTLRPAWIAHAVVLGVIAVCIAAMLAPRWVGPSRRAQAAAGAAASAGFGAAFVLCLVASLTSLQTVGERAAEAAKGAPYCIQVADNSQGSYEPARARLDLSGLTMWSLSRVLHHAILVVGDDAGPRFMHWSYRNQDFVAGASNWKPGEYDPAVTCIPQRDFARHLPIVFPNPSASRYVRLSSREAFLIPDAYQPRWSGGQTRSLVLATGAPDFQPLDRSWSRLSAWERDSNWVFLEWNPDWLLSLMSSIDGRAVDQGTEFGLRKTLIVFHGKDGKDYESYRYTLDNGGSDSDGTTLIQCGTATAKLPKSCQHRFLKGGRHYYFRQRPEDVPHWREMQQKLLGLFASFEANAQSFRANASNSD
jgi:hypothetical protein